MSKLNSRAKRNKHFSRRYYRNFKEIREDFQHIFRQREFIRRAMRELISYDFRERLMMIVTEVNGCKYCRDFHLKEALKSGVSEAELAEMLEGRIPEDTPPEEYPALVYAQRWAESNAQPDEEATQRLIEIYGQEKADAIHIVLRIIRMGNLSGNLLDYFLFKLSFGKLGRVKNEDRYVILK